MEELFRAVLHGDVDAAARAVEAGADVNAVDEGGDTPLCHAAGAGDAAMVRRLLELGADANFGTYALPLIEAAGKGHLAAVEALLAAGADWRQVDEQGSTALHDAAAAGHMEVVRVLVRAGADPAKADVHGKYAAECAAERGHTEPGYFLLALTPSRARERILRMLNGEDPDPVVPPEEQLLRAAWAGDLPAVRRLLSGGVKADAKDDKNTTPLQNAASRGHLQIVQALVEAGADVNWVDGYGGTALDYARLGRRRRVAEYLYPLTEPGLSDRPRPRRQDDED